MLLKSKFAAKLRTSCRALYSPLLALACVFSLKIMGPNFSENLELQWLDGCLRFRAAEIREGADAGSGGTSRKTWRGFAKPLDERIRFVELQIDDEHSQRVARDGEFEAMAQLLEKMAALRPRVIVLDVLYSFGRESEQRRLSQCIRRINVEALTTVVLPTELRRQGGLGVSLPAAGGSDFQAGVVNVAIDRDRIWRRYRLTHEHAGRTLPSLALAAFSASQPTEFAVKPDPKVPGAMTWMTLNADGDLEPATANSKPFLLNVHHSYFNDDYDRAAGIGQRVWQATEIMQLPQDDSSSSHLQDAIVFVGYGGDIDGKPTVHGAMEPGMLLHATALDNLLNDRMLQRTSMWQDFAGLILVAGLAAIAVAWLQSSFWLYIVGFSGLLIILPVGSLSIWLGGQIPATISMAALWSICFLTEISMRLKNERRERLQRDAFLSFSFSPSVLKQVLGNLSMIQPRSGQVAVLLSDLRNFTSCCETLPPAQVFELLNRLFTVETTAALQEDGSLRPFSGDQFLAYWGAPESCDDAADRALRTALTISRELDRRRSASDADRLDPMLNIGIGLHFGTGLVGHVGSRQYRDYNILGDLVNTAARVESQTKVYNAPILATEEFVQALSVPIDAILLDRIRVKGRQRPVRIYYIPCQSDCVTDEERAIYASAFSKYEKGNFPGAQFDFLALKDSRNATLQAASRLLASRCVELTTGCENWDGVFNAQSK